MGLKTGILYPWMYIITTKALMLSYILTMFSQLALHIYSGSILGLALKAKMWIITPYVI